MKEMATKKVLDRKVLSGYLAVTSVVRPDCWVFTERERADMTHDDKSQDETMPRRFSVAVCLFARL
jgi:hypothetical protein